MMLHKTRSEIVILGICFVSSLRYYCKSLSILSGLNKYAKDAQILISELSHERSE